MGVATHHVQVHRALFPALYTQLFHSKVAPRLGQMLTLAIFPIRVAAVVRFTRLEESWDVRSGRVLLLPFGECFQVTCGRENVVEGRR